MHERKETFMRKTRLALFLVILVAPTMVAAQPARDRARTYLTVRIAEKLQLSDEKALAVSALIRQSDERRQQLIAERKNVDEKLRAALARPDAEATELSGLVAQGTDIDRRLALVPDEMFRDAQKILTVEQQARLLLFRRDMQHEVRHAMHRRLDGRNTPATHNPRHPTPTPN